MAAISANRNDWTVLFVAAFVLCYALRSLATGSTILIYRTVKRSEDGLLYWIGVLMALTASIAVIVMVFTDWYHGAIGP